MEKLPELKKRGDGKTTIYEEILAIVIASICRQGGQDRGVNSPFLGLV